MFPSLPTALGEHLALSTSTLIDKMSRLSALVSVCFKEVRAFFSLFNTNVLFHVSNFVGVRIIA